MQSLPMSIIVGHSFFGGNLSARLDNPGIQETSCGVGTSLKTLGMLLVRAHSIEIEASPFNGVIDKFLML